MTDTSADGPADTSAGTPRAATTSAAAPGYGFSRRIVTVSDPRGGDAESVRALAAHLMANHIRDGRRSLAVCAPGAGAGSTFLAVNLAVTIAQTGINTLLVDANLHDPGVDAFIRPESPADGLRQMLVADPATRVDEVRREVLPGLSVLFAGGTGPGSSELVARRDLKDILDDCMRDFEFTVVDTPATHPADLRRIAAGVRHGLIVARRNTTLVGDARALASQLADDRVNLVGTFLTDF